MYTVFKVFISQQSVSPRVDLDFKALWDIYPTALSKSLSLVMTHLGNPSRTRPAGNCGDQRRKHPRRVCSAYRKGCRIPRCCNACYHTWRREDRNSRQARASARTDRRWLPPVMSSCLRSHPGTFGRERRRWPVDARTASSKSPTATTALLSSLS